ncbi:precorrin-2 C(20)-methyltransferase [Tsukamurella ocularis]|uniref:precorrin-2 C(20)-methyltransferase n=1 Tax=Tsukamurella ocularis TaxID=1970234 RepID=UPI002166EB06|nr:precorrin-2 C(20)-methyltransferase [Tsukamurella ocularis]MCS3779723.1 precorrin-2 C20-methyltransferase/precorrin-3B C17-methyltransferase [Tsukamurella ocularis]MCS3788877.1 precorrin-2 C20-methyltransferase/precorrin-3B C17-methyltransferase [Tsukamurella ocularis]MCS3850087.1 precorrin-2 C20-methyltransferase/precorrin-3B C17-methyltransferase [Tsukamurella ocularis]
MTGILYGVGVGPGDPELVTVKAARLIAEADVVAYHSARHGRSNARACAAPYLREGQTEIRLMYPVTTETTDHPGGYRGALDDFYAGAAEQLAEHLTAGRNVVLLAEGDPMFYSSYMHMHKRLRDRFECIVVPGVTSVSAAAAATGVPLVEADEVLTVLPGTLPETELRRRLADTDAAAIMKLGRTFPTVRDALHGADRDGAAWYVERASRADERVLSVADVSAEDVPYFATVLVPGRINAPTHAPRGEVVVVGLGPGDEAWTTPEVRHELSEATDIVGYQTYTDRVRPRPGQRVHASDNRVEADRARHALELAAGGARVAVVSSGDPGVFAMASAVAEVAADPAFHDVPVRVLPGMTAANAVASRVGAPLGHDYAVLSLSDYLKPWEVIEERLRSVAAADLAIAVYNPASRTRREQLVRMREVLLEVRSPETVVIVGRAVGSPEETLTVTTLGAFDPEQVDMRCLLIVGSTRTEVTERTGGRIVHTPRKY